MQNHPEKKRGRPRSAAPAPELHVWRDEVWPFVIPRAEYPDAAKDYKNLYEAIASALKAEGRIPPHWKSLEAAFAGRSAGSGTMTKIQLALSRIYPDFPAHPAHLSGLEPSAAAIQIGGFWEVIYAEDDLTEPLHITRERALVQQSDQSFTGEYTCLSYNRAHNFSLEGSTYGDTVIGVYFVPGRRTSIGRGTFQLAASREGEWLEGYCTWMDFDWMEVRASKCIWYRADVPYASKYKKDALHIMAREIERSGTN